MIVRPFLHPSAIHGFAADAALLESLVCHIREHHLVPILSPQLGYTRPHQASSEDRKFLDVLRAIFLGARKVSVDRR